MLQLPRIVVSPMADVTNWPYRIICQKFGGQYSPNVEKLANDPNIDPTDNETLASNPNIDPTGALYVSEMVNATAISMRIPASEKLLQFHPSEKFRSLQIFGNDPADFESAAGRIVAENLADHLDLNFGCPAAKITRKGGGSALPWKTKILEEVCERVSAQTNGKILLSAKFRIGLDDDHKTYMKTAKICEKYGFDFVTLHARTTAQHYSGKADWNAISLLKNEINIPVYGNGDVFSRSDIDLMFDETGCDGVAIGRGILGRPWLIASENPFSNNDSGEPNFGFVADIFKEHLTNLIEFHKTDNRFNEPHTDPNWGEYHAIKDIRKFVSWYFKGYPVGSSFRSSMVTAKTSQEVFDILNSVDRDLEIDPKIIDDPRGKTSALSKLHLPENWLESE
ncbi:MAG: tRNA-dihydrouridine synthase [Bifidobacteriaceae bacterium]|jgi:nifR3 family TIM-barrel protein|nr:tRNA-dihydrouridine synthase [Bifidobacteriaceae bacterium]